MYDPTIPRRIARRREDRGLASYELAKRAGISPSYLSLIETCRKIPSLKVALKLAVVLDDDPELYRAWVETAGDHDLEGRADRLHRMRQARSTAPRPAMLRKLETGMREWQQRRKRARVEEPRATISEFVSELGYNEPSVVAVPLLDEGTDPAAGRGESFESTETVSIDAGLLDDDQDREQLFAYRVSARSIGDIGDVVSAGDTLVLAADWHGLDPAAIYAVRFRGGIRLTRVAYTQPTLLLMPGPGGTPIPITVPNARALRRLLAGVVVASLRSWPKPQPLDGEPAEPSLGRGGRLDDGHIVRDCEWKEDYGWRPLQKPDDMDYLVAHPDKTIRFRLLRDGRARYVLEMNAQQWQAALGDYFDGPSWYRNGYVVAITKRVKGSYTEEFQERWASFIRKP